MKRPKLRAVQTVKYGVHINLAEFGPKPELKTLYMGENLTRGMNLLRSTITALKKGEMVTLMVVRLTDPQVAMRERGEIREDTPEWLKSEKEKADEKRQWESPMT